MVMELMEYGSVYDCLQNHTVKLDNLQILRILCQVAAGIQYLHMSNPPIIHGDLKSRNILLDKNLTAKVSWMCRVSNIGVE